MVRVQVADHHQRERRHAEPVQAGIDGAVARAGVDEHRSTGLPGRENERVTLTDVAGHHDPPARWPARPHHPRGHQHQHQPDHHGEQQSAHPADPQEQQDQQHEQGQQRRPRSAGRPRQHAAGHRGGVVGHHDQPPDRGPGEPRASVRRPGRHRGQDGRDDTQHRRRGHGWYGEQVRHDRHQAHRAAQPGDQRCGGQAGGCGHRERLGRTGRHAAPPQRCCPTGRHEHQRGRGHHRQRETRVGRQGRVREQQHRHRRREGGHSGPSAPEREGQQHDAAHRGGPQHARRGPGEHDEAEHRRRTAGRCDARVGAQQPQQAEHGAGHDRQVGPRHGSQVREPRGAEVVVQLGRHRARVADGKPGQQRGGGLRQDACRRTQPLAQRACATLPPGRRADVARLTARPEHADGQVGSRRGREQPVGDHRLTGQHGRPPRRRRDQQYASGAHPPPTCDLRCAQRRRDRDLGRSGSRRAQRPRVVPDDEVQRRGRPALGCGPQRVPVQDERVGRDHEPRRGRASRRPGKRGSRPPSAPQRDHQHQDAECDGRAATTRAGFETEEHRRPHGGCRRHQPQICRPRRNDERGHIRTNPRSWANRRSPMPSTSRS